MKQVLLIIILGLIIYGNSVNSEFIYDDKGLVVDNVFIRNPAYIPKFFTDNIFAGSGAKSNFYRPLQMLTYTADYSLWKLNARGYHFTNILLHILTALCVFRLVNILFGDRVMSFLAGIFFLAHPIHTEAVSYIAGRADPLAALFILLCFVFYIKYLNSDRISLYLLALFCYIFAILSKESSLILPIFLFMYHYTFKRRLDIKKFLPITCIAFVYILMRIALLRPILVYIPSTTTLFQRIPGFLVAITDYTRLLFLPFNLHMERAEELFNFADPRALSGIAISSFLLFYAFRKREDDRSIFFSISWFFIALLPISNLYPINAHMAEHWLYLPSVGFFLVLARALSSFYGKAKIFATIFIAVLLTFFSYLTIRQNDYWKDSITFYERTMKYAPDNPRVCANLATNYAMQGKEKEAITLYKKTIETDPSFVEAYSNLGNIYNSMGKKNEAISLYKKAIEIKPDYAKAHNNLATLYNSAGRKNEAITLYRKAISIDPVYVDAYYNLGVAYHDIGKRKEAVSFYRKAIELNPDHKMAHNNLAVAYYENGQYDLARGHCRKALELGYKVSPEFLEKLKKQE